MENNNPWKIAVEVGLQVEPLYRPRRYLAPNGYINPAAWSAGAWSSMYSLKMRQPDEASTMSDLVLLKAGVPTYFVSEAFCDAAAQTKMPSGLTLADIQWPAEGLLFCLPLAFSKRHFGHEVPFLQVTNLHAGKLTVPGFAWVAPEIGKNCVITCGQVCPDGTKDPIRYHRTTPISWSVDADGNEWPIEEHVVHLEDGPMTYPKVEDEKLLLNRLHWLAIKFLLLMTAEPGLVEAGTCQRKAREKHGKKQEELWSPNFIGRTYSSARESLGGTHASPRFHFRRGHMHTVAHGVGRELRKVQWFKPVWVNLNNET